MNIAMGIINLAGVRDYFLSGLSRVPWFPAIMSVGRFEQICQYLHLSDNKKTPDRNSREFKLYKLGKITERECSLKCYNPNQQLNIDEQMIETKSRIGFV